MNILIFLFQLVLLDTADKGGVKKVVYVLLLSKSSTPDFLSIKNSIHPSNQFRLVGADWGLS